MKSDAERDLHATSVLEWSMMIHRLNSIQVQLPSAAEMAEKDAEITWEHTMTDADIDTMSF